MYIHSNFLLKFARACLAIRLGHKISFYIFIYERTRSKAGTFLENEYNETFQCTFPSHTTSSDKEERYQHL